MTPTIDELSIIQQQVLTALLEAPDGKLTARELVDRTRADDTGVVLDQVDGMLGLADTDPFLDATTGEEATHVRLTDTGEGWARSQRERLAPPVTVEGSFRRIDRLVERIDELERRVARLESDE